MLKFHAGEFTIDAAQGETPRRTISGIALRYNTEATVSDGTRVMFEPGSVPVDGPSPKLFMFHDATKVIGRVIELAEVDGNLLFAAKVSETSLGNEALVLASDGAISEVSVGIEPTAYKFDKNGTMIITASRFLELSLVPHGAFDAPILDVAASIQHSVEEISNIESELQTQEQEMNEPVVEAPAVIEASPIQTAVFAQPRREFRMPSAAEYLSAIMQGGSVAAELHAKVKAAAPDVVTGDLDGILPLPIISPVYNNFVANYRPLIQAVGPKAMPQGGKVFIRPKVTTHTSIGGPETENTAITDGTFVVSDLQVTKQIFGGYVQVSEASIDWSQPEVLGVMLDDMARIYANQTDAYACTQFEAGVSQTATLTDPTSAADWASFVYEAASTILANSNGNLPNALAVGVNQFQNLGKLVDDAGRPLFPQVGPMNAFGSMNPASVESSAFGLRLVVDRNLNDDQAYVMSSDCFEVFEQMKGAISLDNPSNLSRTIAFRGYLATLMIDATKVVKIAA